MPWFFVGSAKACIWVWVKIGFSKNSMGDTKNTPTFVVGVEKNDPYPFDGF
jgi:hypothetical protein